MDSDEPGGSAPGTRAKAAWRARLLAERDAVPAESRATDAEALARFMVDIVPGHATACCYVPFGAEPGSLAMVDALRAAGAEVLLPVVPEAPGPLDWASYDGPETLRQGELRGLLEPAGRRIGPDGLARASVVFVPALAIDRRGVRLGRGAGYYDRSLPFAAPSALLIAVVRDAELVPELPAEPHDIRMGAALTPGRGLVPLPV